MRTLIKIAILAVPLSVLVFTNAIASPVVSPVPTALVGGVYRIGTNLGRQDFFGCCGGNYMQNMFDNPGFEQPTDGHLGRAASGATAGAFTDSTDGGEATGFWVGANLSVRTGLSAGDTMVVTAYTHGGAYTVGTCKNSAGGSITCPTLEAGAAFSEVLISGTVGGFGNSSNIVGGWRSLDNGFSSLSTADKFDGNGSLAISVADGNSHSVTAAWDTTGATLLGGVCSNDNVTPCTAANQTTDCGSGNSCLLAPQAGPWHPVVGNFEISLYAKGASTSTGTPQLSMTLARPGGTNVSHTWTLTNDAAWHQYTYSFTGTDTLASAQNLLQFTLAGTNGSAEASATIYVDDIYLGKTTTSTTGFRPEMITTLQTINPGSLRYGANPQLAVGDAGYEGLPNCVAGNSGPNTIGSCDQLHGPAFITGGVPDNGWTFSAADVYPLAGN